MEPARQVEIQLGHLCTNRCVFCVSGQRNAHKTATVLQAGPILERISAAREAGHRKITLLGGEPTLQPCFMDVVRHCVKLGYEEIVVFTNGARAANPSFVDGVLATGGSFTWRLSVQGADRHTHERTTRRGGSFGRLVRALENLSERGQRITVNTCLVETNYEGVDRFPDLLLPFGIRQLHLDMMRPKDAGKRSDGELRATIPRYPSMAAVLERMVEGFERRSPGFDVNIGNLPQCTAPRVAPWIRHDGEMTETFAIDGRDAISEPWNKYEVKARDKLKLEGCRRCLFDAACTGVYEAYVRLYGKGDLRPVGEGELLEADPERRLLPLHLGSRLAALEGLKLAGAPARTTWTRTADDEVTLTVEGRAAFVVALRPPAKVGIAACDLFSLHVRAAPADRELALRGLSAIFSRLAAGRTIWHPVGADATGRLPGSLGARLSRLRRAAPFPHLAWARVRTGPGRVDVELLGPREESVVFWLEEKQGRPSGGYRLEEGEPSSEVVHGLRAMMEALSSKRTEKG